MDKEIEHIVKWVEKYPKACPLWLGGSKARVHLYDPDYMKMILGRSGENETHIAAGTVLS